MKKTALIPDKFIEDYSKMCLQWLVDPCYFDEDNFDEKYKGDSGKCQAEIMTKHAEMQLPASYKRDFSLDKTRYFRVTKHVMGAPVNPPSNNKKVSVQMKVEFIFEHE